jgi:hypothetical protein
MTKNTKQDFYSLIETNAGERVQYLCNLKSGMK